MRGRMVMILVGAILGGLVLWRAMGPFDSGSIQASPTPSESARMEPLDAVSASPPEPQAAMDWAAPPSSDDPEALAAWFQERVLRGLEKTPDGATPDSPNGLLLPSGPRRDDPNVNWNYVREVLTGRVSGIPNERQAGLSLQEIDQIGDIPYVEQLRKEQRFDELRALGFENETAPWPACLRSGTCRRDRASSPPS